MENMVYKEDCFQIEEDGYVVDLCQVEDSSFFDIEIFPTNQSLKSFESAEFSDIFNIEDYNKGFYSYGSIISILPPCITRDKFNETLKEVAEIICNGFPEE